MASDWLPWNTLGYGSLNDVVGWLYRGDDMLSELIGKDCLSGAFGALLSCFVLVVGVFSGIYLLMKLLLFLFVLLMLPLKILEYLAV